MNLSNGSSEYKKRRQVMPVEKQKSLKLNMILNAIRSILSVLFPLITFPYISKILGVENIGRFNYSSSIINYFILISELGIGTYAIRNGSAFRENRMKLNQFADEMFTINMLSMVASYILLILVIFAFPGLKEYWTLLVILSFQIILKMVGIDWIYSIYEDYLYITVRSIAFQILSLVLLFCLVHAEEDLNVYAVITVFANASSSILNYVHARKRIKIGFTKTIDWKRHIRPIFVMFAMSLTVSIYVSSDVTVLGVLCGNKAVGIYSVSAKIYTIVKSLLSTIIVVSIPRLSAQFGSGRLSEFRETANDIYRTLITAMLPAITGIIILRKPIVLLISGSEYAEATSSLSILSIALFMCMAAWFWGQCILVPMKREDEVFKVTLFSAMLNLMLNLILIPKWQENAAALTTVLAEGCTLLWSMIRGKKISGVSGEGKTYLKAMVGCIGIVIVNATTKCVITDSTLYVVLTVIFSIVVYAIVEIFLKNEAICNLTQEIKGLKILKSI